MSSTVRITANGESHTVAAGTTLAHFLGTLDLPLQRVVVERNRKALAPSESPGIVLENGDRLEIVRIAAGG